MKTLLKIALVLLVTFTMYSCKETKEEKVINPTEFVFTKEGTLILTKADGNHIQKIDIELAQDDYERETGLMHRTSMEPLQGMLFILEEERVQNFHMMNTLIPLDLIYIDSNKKIVAFAENAKPLDLTSLSSQVPAKYVLEINGGLAEEWVIEIGDTVDWTKD